MIHFTTTIMKYGNQGEKTGWTYIPVPAAIAGKLKAGNRKSFRVKGMLDQFGISGVALLPVGGGDFIMPFNASMRKGTGKREGAQVSVHLAVDEAPIEPPAELLECLADEPDAKKKFLALPKGQQNYFSKWIGTAKTPATRAKRIGHAVDFLAKGKDFGEMLRSLKEQRQNGESTPG